MTAMLFQEAIPDSLNASSMPHVSLTGSDLTASNAFNIGSLLDLAGQAGGFQWPIFGVLVAGLLLLAARFVQLLFDQYAARTLHRLPLDDLQPDDLRVAVEKSADSLYARLTMGLVELWASGAGSAALGQESAHLVAAAGAPFKRTERVITFLSGMAGGLGLLGTLVGIYVLFSAGARDAQTIFAGIGIAVISTLLGIAVSIVLELFEVLTHGWAGRYLAHAEEWATRLRYRLLELREAIPASSRPAARVPGGCSMVTKVQRAGLQVEKVGTIMNARPGQDVGPLGIRVLLGGRVASGVPVVFKIAEGGGRFHAGEERLEATTNSTGVAAFTLTTGEQEGLNIVEADVEGERVHFTIPTRRR